MMRKLLNIALIALLFMSCSDDKDEPVVPPPEDETVDSPYPSFEEIMEIGEGFLWRLTRQGVHLVYADTGEEYDGRSPQDWPDGIGFTPRGIYFEEGKTHIFYDYGAINIRFIPEEPYDPKTGLIYKSKNPNPFLAPDIQIVAIDEEKITVRFDFCPEVFDDGSKGERLVCSECFFTKQPNDVLERFLKLYTFTDDPRMYP